MATSKRHGVPFRRVREGKTNYKTRLNMLKGKTPRLVIRKSLKNMTIQSIEFEAGGDKVTSTTRSTELVKMGWKHSTGNTPSAYLTGLLAGTKLIKLGKKKLVLDLGLQTPSKGARLFAALKGVIDSGVEIPHNEEILPDEVRITGKHIADHGKVKNAATIVADTEMLKSKITKG